MRRMRMKRRQSRRRDEERLCTWLSYSIQPEVCLAEGQEVWVGLASVGFEAVVTMISSTKRVVVFHQL